MEPMFPKASKPLVDRAMHVFKEGAVLGGLVHPITRTKIAELLRHINSYYSNRIEGEHTTPADVERAVRKEYSKDEKKKRLQLLSVAHIEVQTLIDERLENEPDLTVCSSKFLCWIHEAFYKRVPESFLKIRIPDTEKFITMIPGELRTRNVEIGEHLAPDHHSLNGFLARFEEEYDPAKLAGEKLLLAAAASHHRLTWIHPFLDGNGRVTRLFSYAYMRKAKMESYGLWTMSRGLARRSEDYKLFLSNADSPRRGNYDGRGTLSEEGLNRFCDFFFEVAEDQVRFMNELLSLSNLRNRIMGYVDLRLRGLISEKTVLREEAKFVLAEVMMRGEIARGEVARLVNLGERTARDLTKQLLEEELVVSDTPKGALKFNIPSKVVGYYFPALYPEGSI